MSDQFVPPAPVNIPLGAFEKGIFADRSSVKVPVANGVISAKNLHIIDNCYKRRPTLEQFAVGNSGTHLSMKYVPRGGALLWKLNGTAITVLWDEKQTYNYSSPFLSVKSWTYSTGTVQITAGHTTITGTGTSWLAATQYLRAGDLMSIQGEPAGVLFTIQDITANGTLHTDRAPAGTGGGKLYKIRRAFGTAAIRFLDWTLADSKLILADSARPFYYHDGVTFAKFGDATWAPKTVAYFMNRIWGGRIQEGANVYRQRLRWSQIIDHTKFLSPDGTDSNWLDLNISPSAGEIVRILPLSSLLMIYGDDFIFAGSPQNVADSPISPSRIETGGVGLVGMRALTPFLGAHFFVGQDDIYRLTSTGISRIGTQVVKKTLRNCTVPYMIQSVVDLANDRIIFGFPETSDNISKLWSYFYKTEGWTYDEIEGTSLAGIGVTSTLNWNDLTTPLLSADNWDVGMTKWTSWDAVFTPASGLRILVGQANGRLFVISKGGTQDQYTPATNVPIALELGDFDHELPDEDKTWLRFSLNLKEVTPIDLIFTVKVSGDRGITYKPVGNLVVYAGTDTGYVNFRSTGTIVRILLEASQASDAYSIASSSLRVRARGLNTRAVAT